MFIFFTEIVRKDVVDRHGRWVGNPCDLVVRFDESYPRAVSLIASRGFLQKTYSIIPWKDVHQTTNGFQLKVAIETLITQKSYRDTDFATLRSAVLDQQVVDTLNRKVVRVNDLHFLRVDNDLRLAHVDIGLRGLVRRLGWERIIDGVVRFLYRHASYLTNEAFISWKYVQPLSIQATTGKVQLTVEMEQLKSIPPPDISTMLMELDPYERAALLKTFDVGTQVDIITELELKWQKDLIEELDAHTAVALFERMPADEATDLLAALAKRDSERILGLLSPKKSRELTELSVHEADSAGGLMTTEYIALKEDMTVGEAIDHIRHTEFQKKAETIHNAFVIDEGGRLLGGVSFRRLLLEPMETRIGDVMLHKPPAVHVSDSVEEVARAMDKYNLFALPAVDEHGILEGIITVDDVLHVAVDVAWGQRSGL